MTGLIRGAVVLTVLACSACTPTEPRSAIVEHAEKAGSVELRGATSQSIQQWLGRNRQVAVEIENMCKTVRQSATAGETRRKVGCAQRRTSWRSFGRHPRRAMAGCLGRA